MSLFSKRFLGIWFLILLGAGSCYLYFLVKPKEGVVVIIENMNSFPVNNVIVSYCNQSEFVGSISKGEKKTLAILPQCDTSISISFETESGHFKKENAGGYFGPYIAGEFVIQIEGESVSSKTRLVN